MTQGRKHIAKLFQQSAYEYLREEKITYYKKHFSIKERQLQDRFALNLMRANFPFTRERTFPDSSKKYDFRVFDMNETHVEIEVYALRKDRFGKKTFADLEKLDVLRSGWAMFLALNISDKYTNAGAKVRWYKDPCGFAGDDCYLADRWKKTNEGDLLKCNTRFWCWPTAIGHRTYTACVLTCFGRRTRTGWIAE